MSGLSFTHCLADVATGRAAFAPGVESGANRRISEARPNNPPSAMNASTATSMRTNVAVALCITICAVKRSNVSVITGTCDGARSPIAPALNSVPGSWLSKGRFGDWEADTIVGARHKGGILSVVERKSKLVRLRKLTTKSATEMKDASIELLTPLAAKVHTITVDNGKEFCEHQLIAAGLRARIYFAHPYASWERGLNENTNGLVRQYFPKKYEFASITERRTATGRRPTKQRAAQDARLQDT